MNSKKSHYKRIIPWFLVSFFNQDLWFVMLRKVHGDHVVSTNYLRCLIVIYLELALFTKARSMGHSVRIKLDNNDLFS